MTNFGEVDYFEYHMSGPHTVFLAGENRRKLLNNRVDSRLRFQFALWFVPSVCKSETAKTIIALTFHLDRMSIDYLAVYFVILHVISALDFRVFLVNTCQ